MILVPVRDQQWRVDLADPPLVVKTIENERWPIWGWNGAGSMAPRTWNSTAICAVAFVMIAARSDVPLE